MTISNPLSSSAKKHSVVIQCVARTIPRCRGRTAADAADAAIATGVAISGIECGDDTTAAAPLKEIDGRSRAFSARMSLHHGTTFLARLRPALEFGHLRAERLIFVQLIFRTRGCHKRVTDVSSDLHAMFMIVAQPQGA